MNILKELIGNTMMISFTSLIAVEIIHEIATRIKNKQKMKRNQQIIRTSLKILKSVYQKGSEKECLIFLEEQKQ